MSKPLPQTCLEAASRFREWAEQSNTRQSQVRLEGQAEILEAFGDAPVPQTLINDWDFER
jgi:hypothetical protein